MAASSAAREVLRWAAGLAIAMAAAALFVRLGTPIPWMLGPLFAIAALRVGGIDVRAPPGARYLGQWIIGTALGLYFTPAAMRHVAGVWYLPVAGAAFSIAIGYVSGAVLARLARIDLTTALFASVPGGAAEMSTLAERFGARVDRVAAAQSLRMAMVVAIVPALFALGGAHGSDVQAAGTPGFDAAGFGLLMAVTLAGALVAQRYEVPNAFVIGALAVAIPLTASEAMLSSMPAVVSNAGQLLIGCALGARFQRDFLRGAPRFVGGVVVSVLLSIALATAFGFALAYASGQDAPTVVLGMAPGGIAEMAITAKVLQLGVPLVTAFHVTRLVVLLLATGPVFARARAWKRRKVER
jgi:membrane AbrB-like protein